MGGFAQANTLESRFMKNVEKAWLQTQQQQEPHLTKEEMEKLPILLWQATMRVHADLGLTNLDEKDVILEVYAFLDGYNLLEEKAVTEQEFVAASKVSQRQRTHALHWAVVTILPEPYKKVLVPQLYPEVKNWNNFYKWCQLYMNEFYRILEQLAYGNKEYLEEVFLIDPD